MVVLEPLAWKRVVTLGGCIVHDDPADCVDPLEGHHVISQQALRKRGLHDFLWDVRNGVGVCGRAHRRHDLATERIPREKLPPCVWEFAAEHGLTWYLERFYPERIAA